MLREALHKEQLHSDSVINWCWEMTTQPHHLGATILKVNL
jgi:hypothetical protein